MRALISPEDWTDSKLVGTLAALRQPRSMQHRKYWEYATIANLLEERGLLDGTKTGLGLGTGQEVLCFHLARHAQRVIATDLFSDTTEWDCARLEPKDAYEKSPFPYPRERLEFRNMDMRKIDLPDESVDFVWSTSSVEHVNTVEDYLQVFQGIARVLKPGGMAVIVTEFNLRPHAEYLKNLILVDVPLLHRVQETSGLRIEGPLDFSLPDHPNLIPFSLDHLEQIPFWGHLPNLWAHSKGSLFTSARFVFHKAGSAEPVEVSHPLDPALVEKYDRLGRALRQMAPLEVGAPANEVIDPAPPEIPLRHLFADRVNEVVKQWAGPVHRVGRQLSGKLLHRK